MALSLGQAATDVRADTRHELDLVRLPNDVLYRILNDENRTLSGWLHGPAPQLGLITSPAIVLDDGDDIALASVSANFANLYRVERLDHLGVWRRVLRANPSNPTRSQHGGIVWREEAHCLIFANTGRFEASEFAGSYRVLYHNTPPVLSDPAAFFQLPAELETVLKLRGNSAVCARDRDWDESDRWMARADKRQAEAEPDLHRRFGAHEADWGLVEVVGY